MNFTHKSLYHILGKSLLLFTVFFFFFFHNCFSLFHEKEKEMCSTRRSAVKWFCLCWLQILCDVVFFYKKVSKSYQQNHVLYNRVYIKLYTKKKTMTKKKETNSLRLFLYFLTFILMSSIQDLRQHFVACLLLLSEKSFS